VTAAEIAAALGGTHRCGGWWRCRCPVHASHGPTLALRDGEHGLIVKCWAGCDSRDVLAMLRRRGLHGATTLSDRTQRHFATRDNEVSRIALAGRLWDMACAAGGGPVARYLAGRGITMTLPPSLRYAPVLRRPDGRYGPAMVARIDRLDGALVGVHRTWLACDRCGVWSRECRAILGRAAGAAVRLAEPYETLTIGEGIETCLSAMQATGMPAWAALSTSGMIALALPPGVREIIILADNDASGAGERAARKAAARWLAEGRTVRIAMPQEPGADFNDVLMGRTPANSGKARHAA
jgi:putative DNA primase/helicase